MLPTPLTRARIATSLIFLVHGVIIATWASRIPYIQASLGLSAGQFGLTLLGSAVGAIVAMPLASRWLSRFGSRPVVIWATLALCLTLPGLALAPSALWLVSTLFLFGLCAGAMDVAMNAHAVTLETAVGHSVMIGFHALFSLGGMAGSLLGGLFAGRNLLPSVHYLVMALIMIGVTLAVVGWLLPADSDRTPTRPAGAASPAFWVVAQPSWPLAGLCLIGFCSFLSEGAIIDWSGLYLVQVLGSSQAMAPLGYGLFSLTMAGGRLMGDAVADRMGAERLALVSALIAAAGVGLAVVAQTPALALTGFMVCGLGFAAIVPLVFSGAGRLPAPGRNTSTNLATVTLFSYGAFLLGPTVIGTLSEALGLRVALGLLVGLCLLAAVFAPVAFRSTNPTLTATP